MLQIPFETSLRSCLRRAFFFNLFSSGCFLQGHQIEVRSSGGGHVRGLGTIHGNVDIVTSGDGVSTSLQGIWRPLEGSTALSIKLSLNLATALILNLKLLCDLCMCVQSVDVKKLQGTTMNVSTEHGPLKVKAIYAASSCVTSSSGKIELGNVHGEQHKDSLYIFTEMSLCKWCVRLLVQKQVGRRRTRWA